MNTPYLERLKAAGVTPDQVDMVMCTHLHVDHVGWNTRLENGRWVPTFKNAKYVFSQADYDFYQELDSDPQKGPANGGSFREFGAAGRRGGPGADGRWAAPSSTRISKIEPAPGHTPGTIAIKFESQGEKALFCGDILHHAVQVYHPEWNSFACLDAGQCAQEPARGAGALRRHRARVLMPCHFGAPFTCHIDHKGRGLRAALRTTISRRGERR